jgi:hypothetical protein
MAKCEVCGNEYDRHSPIRAHILPPSPSCSRARRHVLRSPARVWSPSYVVVSEDLLEWRLRPDRRRRNRDERGTRPRLTFPNRNGRSGQGVLAFLRSRLVLRG